jgi:hypothetical protein
MSSTISLSPQTYHLLVQQAKRVHQTPDSLAEELLQRSLASNPEQWQREFESLIERVQERSSRFSSDEIEADITAASQEVKELRRAHRRAS